MGYKIFTEHNTVELILRGTIVLRVRWDCIEQNMEIGEKKPFQNASPNF